MRRCQKILKLVCCNCFVIPCVIVNCLTRHLNCSTRHTNSWYKVWYKVEKMSEWAKRLKRVAIKSVWLTGVSRFEVECWQVNCLLNTKITFFRKTFLRQFMHIYIENRVFSSSSSSKGGSHYSRHFLSFLFIYLVRCPTSYIHTSTVHKTASLADEGNSAYCQNSGNKHI